MSHLPQSFAVISSTLPHSVEAQVMANCAKRLAESGHVVFHVRREGGIWRWLRDCVRAISQSRIVIIHSPLVFSILPILLAFLLRRHRIMFVWDIYPVTIAKSRYDGSLRRRVIDVIEAVGLRLANSIVVPSPDFLEDQSLERAVFVPLWYRPESIMADCPPRPRDIDLKGSRIEPLQVLFAGQVNRTRALRRSMDALENALRQPIALKLACYGEPPAEVIDDARVEYLGGLSREDLRRVAERCDCGLVALHPRLDGAGFPSKTFDYLAYCLPIIYVGPPLTFYCDLLESSGCGIDLGRHESIDATKVRALRADIDEGRDEFFAATGFDPVSFVSKTIGMEASR